MGPFRDYSFDLTSLPDEAKLVAVTGPNGAGKSTLLELWSGGALFRECRTRGSLASLATSRDASLEVGLDNGQAWTVRHTVDSVSGKGESVAVDAYGSPATDSGKVRDFDRWAESHLPRPELLYGSQVLTQGSGGFLDLKPGDRKAVVLRLLGVERLEPMSKSARERAREIGVEASTLRGRIADAEAQADASGAIEALKGAETAAEELARRVTQAQLDLDVAKQVAGDSALARQRYQEQVASLADLKRRHTAVEAELADVNRRIANNRAVLEKADEIRAAVKEREESPIGDHDRAALEFSHLAEAALLEVASLRREAQALVGQCAVGQCADLEAQRHTLRKAIAREDEIRAAVEKLPEAKRMVDFARKQVDGLEERLESLRGERLAGADDRIVGLREGLEEIVRDSPDETNPRAAGVTARGTLSDDDAIVERSEELPRRIEAAETELSEARSNLRRCEERARELETVAALAYRLDGDKKALETVEIQLATARDRDLEIAVSVARLIVEADGNRAKQKAEQARAQVLRDHLTSLTPLLELEKPLEKAETLLVERDAQAAKLTTERDALLAKIEATPEPVPPEASPDVANLEKVLRVAQSGHSAAVAAVGAAQASLDAANSAAVRASELRAQLGATTQEQSDWTRLGEDLGRDGLQAALIDGACGEITAVTNDLLHSCIGSRWTVTLDTQRTSSDGKKQIEGFDVRVLDTEAGRDTTAETLSGGERVLVSEAISLALTALACRKAGVEHPTLVRDETGAALDAEKARGYVSMLRRAATQIGADRVLFVSHSREVQELADARIEVGCG
jgi:DNA repair exonuclease SbcCD ATPase subunit